MLGAHGTNQRRASSTLLGSVFHGRGILRDGLRFCYSSSFFPRETPARDHLARRRQDADAHPSWNCARPIHSLGSTGSGVSAGISAHCFFRSPCNAQGLKPNIAYESILGQICLRANGAPLNPALNEWRSVDALRARFFLL